MSAATIARLKITLDDVKPVVLRRVEVPFDIRLDRLHLTLQATMGWTNSHLYEIRAGGVGWSTPYPGSDFMDARKARLDDVLEDIGTKTEVSLRLRRWLGTHDQDRTLGRSVDRSILNRVCFIPA